MSFFKLVIGVLLLLLAALGALALYGILAAAVKLLFYVGVIALVGAVAYKVLKKSEPLAELPARPADRELEKAERLLEELKRRQLTE